MTAFKAQISKPHFVLRVQQAKSTTWHGFEEVFLTLAGHEDLVLRCHVIAVGEVFHKVLLVLFGQPKQNVSAPTVPN
jgi:hypothetical protein